MIHTPKFPLQLSDKTLFLEAEETKRVVLFHLKNLILTAPGEKISDQTYGVGVKRYLFENITRGLLNNIAKDIDLAIKKYLGYISTDSIVVTNPNDSNTIIIKIAFSIPNLDISEELILNVSDDT